MSCLKCNEVEESGAIVYIRFKGATIGILCCDEHFRLIRELILQEQKPKKESLISKIRRWYGKTN
jgi:hypothetical protein